MVLETLQALKSPIAVSLLAALLVWETFWPAFAFYGRKEAVKRLRHGSVNVLLGAINTVASVLLFVGFWLVCATAADTWGIGLFHWVDLPVWVGWVLAILALDLWNYTWHRLNHAVPFLWRFHKVHHSDTRMDATSALRFHLGEMTLSAVLRGLLILALGLDLAHLAAYELILVVNVFFHHANIQLGDRLDRWLRFVIVTPVVHKFHHSNQVAETNSNYSSFLTIWDRILGTFGVPRAWSDIELGLSQYPTEAAENPKAVLAMPLDCKPVEEQR